MRQTPGSGRHVADGADAVPRAGQWSHATPRQDLHEDRRRGDDRARRRPARAKDSRRVDDVRHGRRAQLADRRRPRDRAVRAAGGRAAAHPERAVRPRVGPGHAGRRARRATRSRPSRPATSRSSRRLIDEFNEVVGPLTNFLLPGGSPGAAQLHVARTVCRRAEREADGPRPRRGDRRRPSSPTSTGCRMRCSSWPATRTTSVASPNRSGSPAPDVACSTGSSGVFSKGPAPAARCPRRPGRGTTGARPVASATTRPANRPGKPAIGSTSPPAGRRTPTPLRRSSAADPVRSELDRDAARPRAAADQVDGAVADRQRRRFAVHADRVLAVGRQRDRQGELEPRPAIDRRRRRRP